MISIIASGRVKASNRSKFMELATQLVSASQDEPGNITYHLCENSKNPEEVIFLEAWEDQAAIDFHCTTEHYTKILPELAKCVDGEMSIVLYKRLIQFIFSFYACSMV